MAYGKNKIVLTGEPLGKHWGVIVSDTSKPGTVMEIKNVPLVNGKVTVQASQTPADGAARLIMILEEDTLQGSLPTVAYVAGAYGQVYLPNIGDVVNMLILDIAGTADSHAIGDLMEVDSPSGKLIDNSGGKQTFTLLEEVTWPVADTLLACMFNG